MVLIKRSQKMKQYTTYSYTIRLIASYIIPESQSSFCTADCKKKKEKKSGYNSDGRKSNNCSLNGINFPSFAAIISHLPATSRRMKTLRVTLVSGTACRRSVQTETLMFFHVQNLYFYVNKRCRILFTDAWKVSFPAATWPQMNIP